MDRKTLVSFVLVAWVSCFAVSAGAATITWDAAATNVDQNNVSQVKNNEYYFDAITSNTSRVLNGVQFHGFSGSTPVAGGNDLQFGTSHITIDNSDVSIPQSYSSVGTTPYGEMLNVGSYRSTGNTPGMSIELSGLTPGLQYQVRMALAQFVSGDG